MPASKTFGRPSMMRAGENKHLSLTMAGWLIALPQSVAHWAHAPLALPCPQSPMLLVSQEFGFMSLEPTIQDAMLAAVPRLRALAISLCRNRDQADDLVQETLLRACA